MDFNLDSFDLFMGDLALRDLALTIRAWLQEPSLIFMLPTATRAASIWTLASLLGLLLTVTNLLLAVRSWRWQRRFADGDSMMREIARSRMERAAGFVFIDLVCVVIGVAALFHAGAYPFLLLFGLLAIRIALPLLALRDFRFYRQMVVMARRRRKQQHHARTCSPLPSDPAAPSL